MKHSPSPADTRANAHIVVCLPCGRCVSEEDVLSQILLTTVTPCHQIFSHGQKPRSVCSVVLHAFPDQITCFVTNSFGPLLTAFTVADHFQSCAPFVSLACGPGEGHRDHMLGSETMFPKPWLQTQQSQKGLTSRSDANVSSCLANSANQHLQKLGCGERQSLRPRAHMHVTCHSNSWC